jgi:hypothetical protein
LLDRVTFGATLPGESDGGQFSFTMELTEMFLCVRRSATSASRVLAHGWTQGARRTRRGRGERSQALTLAGGGPGMASGTARRAVRGSHAATAVAIPSSSGVNGATYPAARSAVRSASVKLW